MTHKNFKNIDKICYGRGSFDQMDEILAPKRSENDGFMVFVVDAYFEGKDLVKRIPVKPEDVLVYIDVDPEEPTTDHAVCGDQFEFIHPGRRGLNRVRRLQICIRSNDVGGKPVKLQLESVGSRESTDGGRDGEGVSFTFKGEWRTGVQAGALRPTGEQNSEHCGQGQGAAKQQVCLPPARCNC